MATDRVLEGLRLTPDDVAEHEFAHGFRGYDVHEVRSFLRIVANEIGRLHEVGETAVEAPSIESLSREQLSELVGEESARVLAAAESAAADIRQRAEDNIAQMLREARTEAAEIRAAADQQRADDIERSESTLSTAHDEAASILAAAEVEAQSIRDRAVEKGREMIAEAQGAKEHVLRDLAQRRKKARRELAQLRAGIDQLQESYDELRSMLDSSVRVVDTAVDDARLAASNAAHRFDRGDHEDDYSAVESHLDETAPDLGEFAPPAEAVEEPPGAMIDLSSGADIDVEIDDDAEAEAPEMADDEATSVLTDDSAATEVPVAEESDEAAAEPATGADEIPTIEAQAAVREAERRTVFQREPRSEPEVETEPADDPVVDEDDGVTELLDTTDLPAPAEPPPLFGRSDTNVDELFARIRSSRENAVERAQRVLAGEDGATVSDEEAAETADAAEDAAPASPAADTTVLFGALDEAVDELGAASAKVLKRMLADQLNEVLDASRRAGTVESIDQLIPADAAAAYGEAISSSLSDAAARGAGVDEADVDIDEVVSMVASRIGGSLRTRVEGYLPGGENLDQQVRAAFREYRRDRVDEVAEAAVVSAFNLGVLSVATGPGRVWVSPEGGCVNVDCADNVIAGVVDAATAFPSGHHHAPVGPGCRCLVVDPGQ